MPMSRISKASPAAVGHTFAVAGSNDEGAMEMFFCVITGLRKNKLFFRYLNPVDDGKFGNNCLIVWKKNLEYEYNETIRNSFVGPVLLTSYTAVSHSTFYRSAIKLRNF